MFTRAFWKDTAERVVSSAAGGALTVMGLDQINLLEADWKAILGGALGTGFISLLKALVASKVNEPDSASLVSLDTPGRHAAPEA